MSQAVLQEEFEILTTQDIIIGKGKEEQWLLDGRVGGGEFVAVLQF